MKLRKFGRLGWQVSEVGFGAWAIGSNWGQQRDAESIKALHRAIDLGCNFIDTARAYGDGRSESLIAEVLKQRTGDRVYVATKVPPRLPGDWPPGPYDSIEDRYPESHVRAELEKSLRSLKTDCLDLVQVHTWMRGWNRNPSVFETLYRCKEEGKVKGIGISTPEHDQNAVIDLIRDGLVDSVQVIYNIFNQEAQEGLLQEALDHDVAVIIRVALDEGSLTGKFTPAWTFAEGDMRNQYFAGDRMARTVKRVDAIKDLLAAAKTGSQESGLAAVALKFALKPAAVSVVIAGTRTADQATSNFLISDEAPLNDDLEMQLRKFNWRRAFWYEGK